MIHLKIAFYAGLIVAMPYVLYELYGFISPALRENEKKHTTAIVTWSYLLFMMGVVLNYFIIFPLAFRFLGTYQVSADVPNIITLASYIDMLTTLTLLMGIMFELPILSWFLAKLGLINAGFMKHYRKHAFVAILIVGAVITPTTDIFTLLLIAAPIYLLYELSINIVRRTAN
jgi:sec-independent protein translocase protein TatC